MTSKDLEDLAVSKTSSLDEGLDGPIGVPLDNPTYIAFLRYFTHSVQRGVDIDILTNFCKEVVLPILYGRFPKSNYN